MKPTRNPTCREILALLHDHLLAYEPAPEQFMEPLTVFTLQGDPEEWRQWLATVCSGIGCEENLDNHNRRQPKEGP